MRRIRDATLVSFAIACLGCGNGPTAQEIESVWHCDHAAAQRYVGKDVRWTGFLFSPVKRNGELKAMFEDEASRLIDITCFFEPELERQLSGLPRRSRVVFTGTVSEVDGDKSVWIKVENCRVEKMLTNPN